MPEYVDRQIVCVECGADFNFSANEQEKFAGLGFTNDPKRCVPCRAAKKRAMGGGAQTERRAPTGPREMHTAICAECGKPAQVPFKPRGDRPVYCSSCFETRR